MKDSIRRRPSPALVVATLALFVALGGTSYAAIALPRDSVGTIQLKAGAVTSPKVRDGSLSAIDLSPAARRALMGRAGAQGPAGPKGDPGADGISGYEIVEAQSSYDSNSPKKIIVACPEGKRILGGSAAAWARALLRAPAGVALTTSDSLGDRSWIAAAQELVPTDEEWYVHATAICAIALTRR